MANLRRIMWRELLMAMSLLIIITTLLLKKDVPDSYKAFEVTNDLLYNESLPTILTPRQAASEPTWDQAVYYGNWLICLMNAPLETLTGWQSKWTTSTTRTLDIYGWERTRRTLGTQDDFDSLALSDIMEDLGISTTFSNWQTVTDHQWNTRPPYKATQARYNNWYNINDGVIIAKDNYSPDWFAKRKGIPSTSVPPLKQWSDLVYLDWASMTTAGPQRQKINHVFRYNIANANTHKMLKLAMGNGNAAAAPALTEVSLCLLFQMLSVLTITSGLESRGRLTNLPDKPLSAIVIAMGLRISCLRTRR